MPVNLNKNTDDTDNADSFCLVQTGSVLVLVPVNLYFPEQVAEPFKEKP